ncbi:MAG TPA: PKD domain-containing protein [Acidobacteriota bacterium]|nr:PKD domain-containing protein [Acidobacteriota bacterium]
MTRRSLLPIFLCVVVTVALTVPGCDELVTEVTEVTIAGHPTAEFGVDIDSGCVPLTVTFQDLSDGPRTGWLWDFGDSTTSTDTNPVHTYDSAGVYTVMLTLEHEPTEGEDTEIKKRFIIAGQSIADFVPSVDSGCPGLEVTFTPVQYGGITAWDWDFGDGESSNDSVPVHVYDTVGQYSVTLTVDGACGQTILTDSNLIQITDCPVVQFAADPVSGCRPLIVAFYDSSEAGQDHAITGRSWSFGDGGTSTDQNPVWTYEDSGTYTVTLEVTSTGGVSIDSMVDLITVYDSTQAAFSAASPTAGCISDFQQFVVKFQDESVGGITSWTWDFGDGTFSNDTSPAHAFMTPGRYTIILEVDGPCGQDERTAADLVVLSDTLQTVSFSISPTTGTTDDVFTFTDLSPGVVLGRDWVFGDPANTGTDSIETFQFTSAGSHEIRLTISNDCGQVEDVDTVVVTAP